jgi:CRP-like cAMP-binding protein
VGHSRPMVAEIARAVDHRANRLLAALDRDDFAKLAPFLEIVDLPRGKVLYETGETIHHAYFPHAGMVSLVTVMQNGETVETATFGREGVLGFSSAFVTRQAFGRYIAQLPGSASRVPLTRLWEAFDASPALRTLLLRFTEALLAQTFQTVACNAVHTVEARCCRWILSTRDRMNTDTLSLSHEVLAEMLGVQRSTVSLVTRTFQTTGLIAQGRGVITITDRAGLEEVACECYGTIRRSFERLLPRTYSDE